MKAYSAYKKSEIMPGRLPDTWEEKPLKHVATVNDEVLSENTDPDYRIRYVDISAVSSQVGVKSCEDLSFASAPSRARRKVRDGDVIISTVRTYLRSIATISEPASNMIVSTGFAVIRPRRSIIHQFLSYALHSQEFVDAVVNHSEGVNYPAIAPTNLAKLKVPVPPLREQQAIAAFLDRETTKIDTLIQKKQRLIELLNEKRAALISHAVTKGLDPGVPMRASGVEWIGDVPAHWALKRNGHLFRDVDNRSSTGEEELLTVSHITGVTRRSEKIVTMFQSESNEGYKLCEPGDLVINTMWAWMGALGVAWEAGIVSPAYNVYRQTSDALLPRYIDYYSRVALNICDITRHSTGIWHSRLRLYPDSFKRIWSMVPPADEQRRIVEYLDDKTTEMTRLGGKISEAIERLQEYRAALISAAVTGQIDVRNEV